MRWFLWFTRNSATSRAITCNGNVPAILCQSAALVHEAYMRLLDQRPFATENRAHFLAVASRLMRQILVDYARSHGAAKRGADRQSISTQR